MIIIRNIIERKIEMYFVEKRRRRRAFDFLNRRTIDKN